MLVVHRVERDHAAHVRRRQAEEARHLDHGVSAHPPAVLLHHPERREERRHFRGVVREELVELGAARADEHRPVWGSVRVVPRRQLGGRDLLPHVPGRVAHRSISPMTMSMLALMAMTSESRWPSTIFGIAERFTNAGGRMRHLTGFEVPSLTM